MILWGRDLDLHLKILTPEELIRQSLLKFYSISLFCYLNKLHVHYIPPPDWTAESRNLQVDMSNTVRVYVCRESVVCIVD